ncbi:MAG TPA: MIP/aquaporin family protein [Burkholderiaceae bacterium]
MRQRLLAEALGTALLLAIVVGSGIMGEQLAGGNIAIALLANSLATGAGLFVLIMLFGEVSGAHFNPAVSLIATLRGDLSHRHLIMYILAQLGGAVIGVWIAHAMFGLDLMQASVKVRKGTSQMYAEFMATFGLVLTILGANRKNQPLAAVAAMVALYITAAYWFTASTSFANPAVTFARSLTNTFAGIRSEDVVGFIVAQCAGAITALLAAKLVFKKST